MLPTTTRIPQVIDRLIELHAAATGYQVTDGAHIGELDDKAICIGLALGERPGYTAGMDRAPTPGRHRYTERWEVVCFLSLISGLTDMKALRDEAGAKLGAIAEALADDSKVDGVWDRVALGDKIEWLPVQAPTGAILSVLYSVEGAGLL